MPAGRLLGEVAGRPKGAPLCQQFFLKKYCHPKAENDQDPATLAMGAYHWAAGIWPPMAWVARSRSSRANQTRGGCLPPATLQGLFLNFVNRGILDNFYSFSFLVIMFNCPTTWKYQKISSFFFFVSSYKYIKLCLRNCYCAWTSDRP